MKTIIVDNKTFVGLRKLDNWLAKQPWENGLEMETVWRVRELITKIQDRGYYTDKERDLLNEIRFEWFNNKYKDTEWVCKYCCKSTKNVEYDYLSGFDHLSCVLEWENNR